MARARGDRVGVVFLGEERIERRQREQRGRGHAFVARGKAPDGRHEPQRPSAALTAARIANDQPARGMISNQAPQIQAQNGGC